MKTIKSIINHTLKNKQGKWSRKSLFMFVNHICGMLVGAYITLSHWLSERELSEDTINVFYVFMMAAGATIPFTIWDKKKGLQNNENHDTDEFS